MLWAFGSAWTGWWWVFLTTWMTARLQSFEHQLKKTPPDSWSPQTLEPLNSRLIRKRSSWCGQHRLPHEKPDLALDFESLSLSVLKHWIDKVMPSAIYFPTKRVCKRGHMGSLSDIWVCLYADSKALPITWHISLEQTQEPPPVVPPCLWLSITWHRKLSSWFSVKKRTQSQRHQNMSICVGQESPISLVPQLAHCCALWR